MRYFAGTSHMNRRSIELWHSSARIIHERFCCNRRSATTTSLRPAGSPLEPSPYCMSTHRVLTAPRAGLATRLSDFATNRHELCGLAVSALFIVGGLVNPCGAQTPSPEPPVQNQAVQSPQAVPSAGVSDQANVGPTSVPSTRDWLLRRVQVPEKGFALPDRDFPECSVDRRSRDRWGPRIPQADTCAPR